MNQGQRAEGWTNNILIEKQKDRMFYYLPCYLRLKVKNIVDLSLTSMQATFNADLIFTIYYGSLYPHLVEQLQNNIVLQFNRNESIKLVRGEETTFVHKEKENILNFTIRKKLNTKIAANLFWSPFELIKLVLVVTLRSIIIQQNEKVACSIHFNLMSSESKWTKISFTKQRSFGDYMLSPQYTHASYSNSLEDDPFPTDYHDHQLIQIFSESDSQKQIDSIQCQHEKIKYFQYAHFYIGMYRLPFVALSTIFFPMWSMGTYNLFMFFENNDLSMRIGNGSILILALFAFIPTIRSQIPDTPNIILVEILLYTIAATLMLNLIQSYNVSFTYPQPYMYNWEEDPWFIFSVVFMASTFLCVLFASLAHKVFWEKHYLEEQPRVLNRFSRDKWKNIDCDEYFKKYDCIKMLK